MGKTNAFNAKRQFELNGKKYNYYSLKALEEAGLLNGEKMKVRV